MISFSLQIGTRFLKGDLMFYRNGKLAISFSISLAVLVPMFFTLLSVAGEPLLGTALISPKDRAKEVISIQYDQVIRYFQREIAEAQTRRDAKWNLNFSCEEEHLKSVALHRPACRKMLGISSLVPQNLKISQEACVGNQSYHVSRLTISRSSGLPAARGLLLQPSRKGECPLIVICPDADTYPEKLAGLEKDGNLPQWLSSLLNRGVSVYIPQSIERLADHPYCKKTRGKDRRAILHRLGFVVGKPMTGWDVEETLVAIDHLAKQDDIDATRIGITGVGQGGMTALCVAALGAEFVGSDFGFCFPVLCACLWHLVSSIVSCDILNERAGINTGAAGTQ